ncbi:MAG: hypothetical protein LBB38_00180 [Puniceicoccales bacterium]|nr:hypothetical protein [Puniceicoccales bacterium]
MCGSPLFAIALASMLACCGVMWPLILLAVVFVAGGIIALWGCMLTPNRYIDGKSIDDIEYSYESKLESWRREEFAMRFVPRGATIASMCEKSGADPEEVVPRLNDLPNAPLRIELDENKAEILRLNLDITNYNEAIVDVQPEKELIQLRQRIDHAEYELNYLVRRNSELENQLQKANNPGFNANSNGRRVVEWLAGHCQEHNYSSKACSIIMSEVAHVSRLLGLDIRELNGLAPPVQPRGSPKHRAVAGYSPLPMDGGRTD